MEFSATKIISTEWWWSGWNGDGKESKTEWRSIKEKAEKLLAINWLHWIFTDFYFFASLNHQQ